MRPIARWILLAAPIVAVGCSSPEGPSVDAGCIAAVRIGGTVFRAVGTMAEPAGVGAVVATVQRQIPCDDTPDPGGLAGGGIVGVDPAGGGGGAVSGLADGESNFLTAGTTVHAVPGYAPTARLAARSELGFWHILIGEE